MNLSKLTDFGAAERRQKTLMITGIAVGAAALLAIPATMLYRRLMAKRKNQHSEEQHKPFAPHYRGNHKPHHRKPEAALES